VDCYELTGAIWLLHSCLGLARLIQCIDPITLTDRLESVTECLPLGDVRNVQRTNTRSERERVIWEHIAMTSRDLQYHSS